MLYTQPHCVKSDAPALRRHRAGHSIQFSGNQRALASENEVFSRSCRPTNGVNRPPDFFRRIVHQDRQEGSSADEPGCSIVQQRGHGSKKAAFQRLSSEPIWGFEPQTCGLRNRCSTPELNWPTCVFSLHTAGAALRWADVFHASPSFARRIFLAGEHFLLLGRFTVFLSEVERGGDLSRRGR